MSIVAGSVDIDFQTLVAPKSDGDVLVSPPAHAWQSIAEQNHEQLGRCDATLLDRPLSHWRSAYRHAFGTPDDQWLTIVGHQPECYHAGVWAKYVVASRFAAAGGGKVLNLIVDNDAAKNLRIALPVMKDAAWHVQSSPLAPGGDHLIYEQIPGLPNADVQKLATQWREQWGTRYEDSCLPAFVDGLTAGPSERWVEQLRRGQKAIDARFDVSMDDCPVSRLPGDPITADMILRPDEFSACYNSALASYRKNHGIAGSKRPVPDLVREGDVFELPLWFLVGQSGAEGAARQRLYVHCAGNQRVLMAGTQEVVRISSEDVTEPAALYARLAEAGASIRPRALTLTLIARLLLADIFIHGIGGAKYDRMTDDLIRRYFGCQPPGFTCVSATALLGLSTQRQDRNELAANQKRMRDFQWNPQRMIPPGRLEPALLARRERAVEESRRLRAEAPSDHAARRAIFAEIRNTNERLRELMPELAGTLAADYQTAKAQWQSQQVAMGREYFYGLLHPSQLRSLADSLPATSDFGL